MDQNKAKIAAESLHRVKEYQAANNFGRAFANYLVYLELVPTDRSNHENEFSAILTNWCVILEERKQHEDLYKCYLKALHYFPLSIEILNNFGTHLMRLEAVLQGKKYLELASNLNRDFLPAEKNLEAAKMNLVPRWHYRMLNDVRRNEAYREAINATVDVNFDRVLDIGTGCGLLSLFASKNEFVKSVVAIEESAAMVEVAKDIVIENGATNITLINKNSIEVTDEVKSNVLVTEIFDTAVFGEHVLETLIHAHENLLVDNAKIIPARVDIYVTGAESDLIHSKFSFQNFDLKRITFGETCILAKVDEPYEAEHVLNHDCNFLTNTIKFNSINFYDLEELKRNFNHDSLKNIELSFIRPGMLQAFVIWFDLYLTENIKISTNPYDDKSCQCWEQAVIYVKHPEEHKKGDRVSIRVSCVKDKLEIKVPEKKNHKICYEVNPETVSFLNDRELLEVIESTADDVINTRLTSPVSNYIILDLSPLPIFGLNLAHMAHIFTTTNDIELVKHICRMSHILLENITFITHEELHKYLEQEDVFDVIFFNPISPNGTINEKFYSDCSSYQNSLKSNGLLLPQRVGLNIELIESDYLDYCSQVDDSNCSGFKIARHMNNYSVYEHWDIDHSFKYNSLSTISSRLELQTDDTNFLLSTEEVVIESDGLANGILYWYDIEFLDGLKYTTEESTFYNRAAFILREKCEVQTGDKIELCAKQLRGFIKISVEN